MELKQKTIAEVVQLAIYKLSRAAGGREAKVFIPAKFLPPVDPYKWVEVDTEDHGTVKLFCFPAAKGGWVIRVRFKNKLTFTFNPVISNKEGIKLLKKLA